MRAGAEVRRVRGQRVLLDAWVALLVAVLCAPMLLRCGHGLARDLVFVPHPALGLDDVGLGSTLPRAVPLDAVVAALGQVVDGAVLFRVGVLGTLLLAGWGAHRMVPGSMPIRLLVAGMAVWNPYVVERLSLGQWALLTSYAALWWIVPAVRTCVDGGRRHSWARLVLWLALASLTPSGGAIALLVVVCVGNATRRGHAAWVAAGLAFALQLTWLIPSVLASASALSDPRGVDAFAARAERPGGVLLSILTGGGIWDRHVVPPSLEGLPGQALAGLCLLVLVFGVARARRRYPGLVIAAVVGLVLALPGSVPGLQEAVGWAVRSVPGGGLIRDGQKWLAPYVVLLVVCAAESVARLETWLAARDRDLARLVAVAASLLPVLLLVDAPGQTREVLTPVHFPSDLTVAMATLDRAGPASGDVVTLPWASYRRYTWGRPVSASDPATRWSARPVVVSDDLRVTAGTLAGEDRRAREIGRIVSGPGPMGDRLAAVGVGWVLVYRDQPAAAALPLQGLRQVTGGRDVALYAVPGPVTSAAGPGVMTRVLVVGVDALVALGVLAAAALATRRTRAHRARSRLW